MLWLQQSKMLSEHGQAIGSILRPALREGQVIYERGQ